MQTGNLQYAVEAEAAAREVIRRDPENSASYNIPAALLRCCLPDRGLDEMRRLANSTRARVGCCHYISDWHRRLMRAVNSPERPEHAAKGNALQQALGPPGPKL